MYEAGVALQYSDSVGDRSDEMRGSVLAKRENLNSFAIAKKKKEKNSETGN